MKAKLLRILPYQWGVWLAYHGRRQCYLCHSNVIYSNRQLNSKNQKFINQLSTYKNLLCHNCHNDISWLPSPLIISLTEESQYSKEGVGIVSSDPVKLSINVAVVYESVLRQAIIAFKYKQDLTALPLLIYALRQLPLPSGCHHANSIILPMPTTNKRIIKRGFEPVTILSKYLSHHWQIPIWQGVKRKGETPSQQGLPRDERLINMQDAFEVIQLPEDKTILLFDDVATTGSSLKSLAKCVNNTSHPFIVSAYAIAHGNHNVNEVK